METFKQKEMRETEHIDLYDFLSLVQHCTNVKTVTYYPELEEFEVTYKNDLKSDMIPEDDIEEFLENA